MNRRRFLNLSSRALAAGGTGLAASPAFALPEPLRAAFKTRPPRRRVSSALRAPQSGELGDVYQAINRRLGGDLEEIQAYLRQPSISAQNVGVRECAEMTAEYLRKLGCQEAGLIETDGHPVVWGLYDASAPKMLVNYGMYDTQPINDPDRWLDDPREAKVIDMPGLGKAILARGAINTKGPLRAYLNALEAIIEVKGTLPVNMIFTIEGEEELGSPNLPAALATEREHLAAADGMLFAMSMQNPDASVSMFLGNKGIVAMELNAAGSRWGRGPAVRNIHGSYAAIVESPVWRLLQALTSMTDDYGAAIRMEGYLDTIRAPSAEDAALIDILMERFDPESWRESLAVGAFIDDLDGLALIERYLYTTTWNIDGIWGGYTGPGMATILPHEATAKVDSRIVPDQRSADIMPMARRHLDRHGFDDVEIRPLSAYEWSKTSVSDPIVQALKGVYESRDISPEIWPHLAGSAPFYLFTDAPLNLPMVLGGMGHGANQHTINEYLIVEGLGGIASLDEIEKSYVDFVFRFAAL